MQFSYSNINSLFTGPNVVMTFNNIRILLDVTSRSFFTLVPTFRSTSPTEPGGCMFFQNFGMRLSNYTG